LVSLFDPRGSRHSSRANRHSSIVNRSIPIVIPMNIVVPQLGESVIEARVARWLKREGENVAAGEALVELETDKIDLEVNADAAGVLARIERKDGEDVKVGEVLGVIDADGAGASPGAEQAADPGTGAAAQPSTVNRQSSIPPVPEDVKATATARKVAAEHGVNLAEVAGSGDGGRITKDDVQRHVQGGGQTPPAVRAPETPQPSEAPPAPQQPAPQARPRAPEAPQAPSPPKPKPGDRTEERVRMSKRRATIAKRLVEAQHNAAMLTTFNEVDMTEVQALRSRRKEEFRKRYGVGLGLSSFFVKAAIGALKAFPRINAEIQGDEMVLKHYYDIGIAVGASQGLVVPVLRDAEQMTFAGIEAGIKDFARRAEEGSLTLEDLKGGSFTITNGGVFGSLLSTPILNPPQVGILGLHKIEERPIALNGQVVVRPMMYVALSYDHRIVDGLEAVQFLVKLKEFIEDPGHLLIEG
jgi:2-oxoglutarate dehydrogenase E2 component (dihydrolipoamide succinyltransferase)